MNVSLGLIAPTYVGVIGSFALANGIERMAENNWVEWELAKLESHWVLEQRSTSLRMVYALNFLSYTQLSLELVQVSISSVNSRCR